jgi:cytochrome c biogenesis protein CcmG/thiol:disulfide interchange protein DsbE
MDGCAARVEPADATVAIGRDVPDFRLPNLDGGCFELARYRGRPLVVNFWASWCHPCRVEFPLLADARTKFASDDLEVIGVDYRDIVSDASAFAGAKGADWPLLNDEDGVVAKLFGVSQIPQTFFIARDGTIVSHVYGLTSVRDLNSEIERTLER